MFASSSFSHVWASQGYFTALCLLQRDEHLLWNRGLHYLPYTFVFPAELQSHLMGLNFFFSSGTLPEARWFISLEIFPLFSSVAFTTTFNAGVSNVYLQLLLICVLPSSK